MAYYYVKSGGTATGDAGRHATQQTGTFAALGVANYYDTLEDASNATTPPASGDYILISDTHAKVYSPVANITLTSSTGNADAIYVISVDDTDIELYKPGASEDISATILDFALQQNIMVAGFSMIGGDSTVNFSGATTVLCLQDLTVTTGDGNADTCIQGIGDGNAIRMVNVDLNAPVTANNNSCIHVTSNIRLEWFGGTVLGNPTNVIDGGAFGQGGADLFFHSVDLSNCTKTFLAATTAGAEDGFKIILNRCRLNASLATLFGTLDGFQHRCEMYNCDDSTSNTRHRFEVSDGAGTALNNDAIYVTNSPAMYGGSDRFSVQISTDADCSHHKPFTFRLPAQLIDLSDTGSDLITLDMIADNFTLTDTDIAVFLDYPDGTTPVLWNWVTSGKTVGAGNLGTDPLHAGTTLAASSLGAADWTGEGGLTSPNYYKIELDTSGDAGAKCVVAPRVEIYASSITGLYLDWQLKAS